MLFFLQKTNPVPRPHSSPAGTAINAEKVLNNNNKNGSNGIKPPSNDLLGLTTTSAKSGNTNSTNEDDQFDAFVSCAPVSSATKPDNNLINTADVTSTRNKTNEEEDFFNQKAPEQKKLDKESILKLYGNGNQVQNNLFNLTSSTTPLQPMNVSNSNALANGFNNSNSGLITNGILNNQLTQNSLANNLFNSTNVINNGFANFNQINNTISNSNQAAASTNPFLNAPVTTPSSNLTSTDLFSSNVNTTFSLATSIETQLNSLNLNKNSSDKISFNWPNSTTTTTNNNISTGQSLFSANFENFDNLTDKKLNGNDILQQQPTASSNLNNPFINTITPAVQQSNNLDILSSFNTTPATNGLNGLSINANDVLENTNWSTLHTTSTNNGLTADLWQ